MQAIFLYIICLIVFTFFPLTSHAVTQSAQQLNVGTVITPSDGFNLQLESSLSPTYLSVKLTKPVHNWFAGTFSHLPIGTETTIGLCMTGIQMANVSKWIGLRPMMTYADPTQYESYEWFQRDAQGQWVSSDPFKKGNAKIAGSAKTPNQGAIYRERAEQFLTEDGQYWCPWREIDTVDAAPSLNIFRIKWTFEEPTATIAMRVPYTYAYLQTFLTKLQAARLPGVTVHTIGMTPGNRKLQVVQIDDPSPSPDPEGRKTIVVIAREHATEVASSWVVHGMLIELLQDTPEARKARKDITWMLIPIEDPDASADAVLEGIINDFRKTPTGESKAEAGSYMSFFTKYCDNGYTIDLAVALHNVEANECENIFSPLMPSGSESTVMGVHHQIFSRLTQSGFVCAPADRNWLKGRFTSRLYGWCSSCSSGIGIVYEVNDRYPQHRLSLPVLQRMGGGNGIRHYRMGHE